MTRHIIPGTDRVIYLISKDQDEFDSDIEALEDILDKTEEQIHITRVALEIIKENKDAYLQNTNLPT
jgi:hypothetical protein